MKELHKRNDAHEDDQLPGSGLAAELAEKMTISPDTTSFIAKISDLGNACWFDKHFSDDIQVI